MPLGSGTASEDAYQRSSSARWVSVIARQAHLASDMARFWRGVRVVVVVVIVVAPWGQYPRLLLARDVVLVATGAVVVVAAGLVLLSALGAHLVVVSPVSYTHLTLPTNREV